MSDEANDREWGAGYENAKRRAFKVVSKIQERLPAASPMAHGYDRGVEDILSAIVRIAPAVEPAPAVATQAPPGTEPFKPSDAGCDGGHPGCSKCDANAANDETARRNGFPITTDTEHRLAALLRASEARVRALEVAPRSAEAFWVEMLDREECGCFQRDCRVHGAYAVEDVERVKRAREAHAKKPGGP